MNRTGVALMCGVTACMVVVGWRVYWPVEGEVARTSTTPAGPMARPSAQPVTGHTPVPASPKVSRHLTSAELLLMFAPNPSDSLLVPSLGGDAGSAAETLLAQIEGMAGDDTRIKHWLDGLARCGFKSPEHAARLLAWATTREVNGVLREIVGALTAMGTTHAGRDAASDFVKQRIEAFRKSGSSDNGMFMVQLVGSMAGNRSQDGVTLLMSLAQAMPSESEELHEGFRQSPTGEAAARQRMRWIGESAAEALACQGTETAWRGVSDLVMSSNPTVANAACRGAARALVEKKLSSMPEPLRQWARAKAAPGSNALPHERRLGVLVLARTAPLEAAALLESRPDRKDGMYPTWIEAVVVAAECGGPAALCTSIEEEIREGRIASHTSPVGESVQRRALKCLLDSKGDSSTTHVEEILAHGSGLGIMCLLDVMPQDAMVPSADALESAALRLAKAEDDPFAMNARRQVLSAWSGYKGQWERIRAHLEAQAGYDPNDRFVRSLQARARSASESVVSHIVRMGEEYRIAQGEDIGDIPGAIRTLTLRHPGIPEELSEHTEAVIALPDACLTALIRGLTLRDEARATVVAARLLRRALCERERAWPVREEWWWYLVVCVTRSAEVYPLCRETVQWWQKNELDQGSHAGDWTKRMSALEAFMGSAGGDPESPK